MNIQPIKYNQCLSIMGVVWLDCLSWCLQKLLTCSFWKTNWHMHGIYLYPFSFHGGFLLAKKKGQCKNFLCCLHMQLWKLCTSINGLPKASQLHLVVHRSRESIWTWNMPNKAKWFCFIFCMIFKTFVVLPLISHFYTLVNHYLLQFLSISH